MTSSVFIKTQLEDLGFLEWAFKFLKKNWLTESQFVISAPHDCTEPLKKLQDVLGHPIELAPMDQWPDKGYLHQQYMKMHADNYCNGEYITFMDSDAMLAMPTTLESLFIEGKPIIWYTEYERLNAPWKLLVSQVMALTPLHEFMRCFPFTYHRGTLKECRERIEQMHGCRIEDLMHNAPTWTEFNILGFHAFVFQRSLYTWRHTDEMFTPEGLPHHWHDRVRQYHRIHDWNDVTRARMEILLNGNREPDREDAGGGVGPQGGPPKRERKKRASTGRRPRVRETDLASHNAGIVSG
jgi:Family of unknown function (DUF6492)